jgi:hypothetical protein
MKTGMLWFDNDPKTDLPTKISRAAAYYLKKYGEMPDVCFVHPTMTAGIQQRAQGIQVKVTRQVLPHHLWLGVTDAIFTAA